MNIRLSDRRLLQCDQQSTVVGAVMYYSHGVRLVYGTQRHTSVNTSKRREQNRFRSGKSETEVTNNRRLRSTCGTTEANYRHKVSRGLSATAGLLLCVYRR